MSEYNKVIFVCSGNTCRSPMAATILVNLMPDIRVESRGMVVLFEEPYNPKAVAVAAKNNMIMPSNVSMQITEQDFGQSTLVLAMEVGMKQKLYASFTSAINVFSLSEFVGENDVIISDPYGKGIEEYNKCFDTIYGLIKKLVNILSEEDKDILEDV